MKASKKSSRERIVFGDATWLHFLSQVIQRKIILQWGMRIELTLNFLGNLGTLLGGKFPWESIYPFTNWPHFDGQVVQKKKKLDTSSWEVELTVPQLVSQCQMILCYQ